MGEAYLQNAWYQAAWSDEIGSGGSLARTLLDIPILMFRDDAGVLHAVHDRCPHRFAPLSTGMIKDATVVCGYHGLGFAGSGKCVLNPHGPITSTMRIRSFPVVERHLGVWLWMGDPDDVDLALLPNLSFIDETPANAQIVMYVPTAANYRLLTDNILDLSHADYLHPTTLGGMMVGAKSKSVEQDGKVIATWRAEACDAPSAFQAMVPPPAKADITIEVTWSAPAVMVLGATATPAGIEPVRESTSWTLHNMTPETSMTSHYFVCSTRAFLTDDTAVSQHLKEAFSTAFLQEDKPMLEQQQSRMGTYDLWSLDPILLPIDAGAVRARRKLDKMIADEQLAQCDEQKSPGPGIQMLGSSA